MTGLKRSTDPKWLSVIPGRWEVLPWPPENWADDTFAPPKVDVYRNVFRTVSVLENISILGECAGKTSSPLMCCQVWPVPIEAQPQLHATSDALSHLSAFLGTGFPAVALLQPNKYNDDESNDPSTTRGSEAVSEYGLQHIRGSLEDHLASLMR